MFRIYLASAYGLKDMVAGYIKRLPSSLEVSHDWTVEPVWFREEWKNKHESELPFHVRQRLAQEDMRGVVTADILWLLTPTKEEGGCGCFIELGIALGSSSNVKEIIVSGADRSIFQTLTTAGYGSHEAAFQGLLASHEKRIGEKAMDYVGMGLDPNW